MEGQGAHQARDPCEMGPSAEPHRADPHPLEGDLSGAGGPKRLHPGVPEPPELHGALREEAWAAHLEGIPIALYCYRYDLTILGAHEPSRASPRAPDRADRDPPPRGARHPRQAGPQSLLGRLRLGPRTDADALVRPQEARHPVRLTATLGPPLAESCTLEIEARRGRSDLTRLIWCGWPALPPGALVAPPVRRGRPPKCFAVRLRANKGLGDPAPCAPDTDRRSFEALTRTPDEATRAAGEQRGRGG